MNTMDPLLMEAEPIPANKRTTTSNSVVKSGYVLLAVSIGLYAMEEFISIERMRENFAIFFIHYFIAIAYTAVLLFNRSLGIVKSFRREHLSNTIVLLNLFLISAYALNREIPVFEDSVAWLCVYLIISSVTILSFRYFSALPAAINRFQYVFLGSALILYLYLSIYCANYYIFGSIGMIALGIGAHIFVPLFLAVACLALTRHSRREKRVSYSWIVCGVAITIALSAGFVATWHSNIRKMERIANRAVLDGGAELPTWVKVAQSVENNWITERILKYDLVYTTANDNFQWDLFPSRARWNERRKHDPLVFISSMMRKGPLSEEERIRILLALTDNRHHAEERLWSGDNLVTSYMITDADIYPDLRLAYTEKYFNIRNTLSGNRTWGGTQEAIYTFQLPEGSVITSLSLWINGKEEKAILTSKQKANEAYTTIVGVEARDPSVVHWREGNTVSVRVFPCTPTEERRFKIGITSPLTEENGRLVYNAITFRGPNAHKATEAFRVRFIGNPSDLSLPGYFEKNDKGEYVAEQDFTSDFSISFRAVSLRANQFTFDGFEYCLSDWKPDLMPAHFFRIYLDINNTWSEDELDKLRPVLKGRDVYAYTDDEFVTLNNDNWNEITSALRANNFSIFPFQQIKNPEESLVISKGQELSPFLSDFKESDFAKSVGEFFASGQKVSVYNISSSMSSYIRSLRELRALNFASGTIEDLIPVLDQGRYPVTIESEEQVVLHDAGLMITRKRSSGEAVNNNGPDHVARLFAYNNIMRQVGAGFFSDDFVNQKLVDEATAAYVVSPVSSLIVLETQKDYERFGIEDTANSLKNASKQSSGAVPEPHEWALIILFAMAALYCAIKQRNRKAIFSK